MHAFVSVCVCKVFFTIRTFTRARTHTHYITHTYPMLSYCQTVFITTIYGDLTYEISCLYYLAYISSTITMSYFIFNSFICLVLTRLSAGKGRTILPDLVRHRSPSYLSVQIHAGRSRLALLQVPPFRQYNASSHLSARHNLVITFMHEELQIFLQFYIII